jgi:hypothetical protein
MGGEFTNLLLGIGNSSTAVDAAPRVDWSGAPWWYLPALILSALVIVVLYCVSVYADIRRGREGSPEKGRPQDENQRGGSGEGPQ